MKYLACIWPALAVLLFSGCQSDSDHRDETPGPAVSSALYRITFEATWSATTHANFPGGAHFSPLIGLAHRDATHVFQPGQLASLGVKNMAELGNNTVLRAEINALRSNNIALSLLDGYRSTASPGSLSDTLRLSAAHPLATVLTMIAPSPDWFLALEGENLLVNGQWAAYRTVPARAYDAGTDSGLTFTALNQPTSPAEPIRPLLLPPASGTATDGPVLGNWHLERIL